MKSEPLEDEADEVSSSLPDAPGLIGKILGVPGRCLGFGVKIADQLREELDR